MLSQTHIIFSQAAFYTACAASGHVPQWWEALLCAFFSLFPADVDHPQSLIGRALPFLSRPVAYWFGHRTLTHSLLAQVVVCTVLIFSTSTAVWLPIMVGWVSHSIADMMTPSGVAWFYPSRVRCVLPGHYDYRISIGGTGEVIFGALMLGMIALMFPYSGSGQGTTGLIRQSIGDVAAAREQYDQQRVGFQWFVEVEGINKDSLKPINGKYKIIAGEGESGFILETKGKDKAHVIACQTNSCEWYLSKARLHKGQAEHVTVFEYNSDQTDTKTLLAELGSTGQNSDVFLIGEATTKEGEIIKLNYDKTTALDGLTIKSVRLKIQARHAPKLAPKFALQSDVENTDDSNLSPYLAKWLR